MHGAEAQILRAADVVCCTCIESATERLCQAITVSLCVVDDAQDASEPEILTPLARAKYGLILEAKAPHDRQQKHAQNAFFERHADQLLPLEGRHTP